ncbi:putative dehydrogenase [Propionicimonas paludicola]|uniref:Putative dehydrogenase n=1 Tax=Propionicimonas paludicola TaxID=185243 RepID=A0A2A9CV54_9ACTN|nr:Gfo/Idh/MocA family oxidoreductase [Propionicimonas paludicola]PFG18313.1 putative dehydrogenase [Propionicimonas paludicola]
MALPQTLPLSRVPDPAAAPALRWGILAPGWIASAFATAVRTHTSQQLVAVGSRSLERARDFADRYGIARAYGSYEELVADPQVDAIYVASPHSEHAAQSLLAIQAGKHVLVEKAFTRNAHEARTVVDAARRHGVGLMEAMWTRFLPRIDIVRQLLEDGVLGELELLVADHGQALTHVQRLVDPSLAGGGLLDLGIYPISFASFVLGTPSKIHSAGELTSAGVDRQISAIFSGYEEHPHAQALVSCTIAAKTPTTAVIAGDQARVELDGDFYTPGPVRLVFGDGQSLTAPSAPITGHQGLAYEAAHFAQLISDGFTESPQLGLDESVSIMETLDELRAQRGVRFPGE